MLFLKHNKLVLIPPVDFGTTHSFIHLFEAVDNQYFGLRFTMFTIELQ